MQGLRDEHKERLRILVEKFEASKAISLKL